MTFKEPLPTSCPPEDAADAEHPELWRLVTSSSASPADFDSHAKKGKLMPRKQDPCRWASCSFFTTKKNVEDLVLLPKLRAEFSHAAMLSIPAGAGLSKSVKQHVDLWMWSSFDPLSAVVKVEVV